VLLSLLGQLLSLGLEMQESLHLLQSSLSTPFSWLCGFWGEALDEVANTLLPNDHSNCSGGKSSCCYYKDFLTYSSSPCASVFVVGLEKPSCHSSFESNLSCGMWLASPSKMPQDGLSFHNVSMSLCTNNCLWYGLSSCSNDKQEMSCLT
jgi:hypothetical protein